MIGWDDRAGLLAELDQARATNADYQKVVDEQAVVVEALTAELLGTREILRGALDLLSASDEAVTALDDASTWSTHQKAMTGLLEVRNRARAWRGDVFDAVDHGTGVQEVADRG